MTAAAFVEPWKSVDDEQSAVFLRELKAEVAPAHPLYGASLKVVARSLQTDDVLFEFGDGRVVEVHLTWHRAVEPLPWPRYKIFSGLQEWVRQVVIPSPEEMR